MRLLVIRFGESRACWPKMFIKWTVFLAILQLVACSNISSVTSSWRSLESFTNQLVSRQLQGYENDVKAILRLSNVSARCSSSISSYFSDLTELKHDAFKISDASGGWPVGIMSGNVYSYGSYEQCLSIDRSQYCVLRLIVPMPAPRKYEGYTTKLNQSLNPFKTETFTSLMGKWHFLRFTNITYGLCMPRGCELSEVEKLAKTASMHLQAGLDVKVRNCDQKIADPALDSFASVSLAVIAGVVVVNLLATYSKIGLLEAFDMTANYKSLLKPSSSKLFASLEGIKAISMFLIIIAHTFAAQMEDFTFSIFKIESILNNPSFFVSNFFPFAVDIFFLVTGIKTMQFILRQGKKNSNVIMFTVTRYLNFLPIVVWTTCIYFLLSSDPVKAVFGGPNWIVFKANDYNRCRRHWIANLFILSTWISWVNDGWGELESCLLTDWYLSLDLVFALLSGLVWFPFSKGRPKLGLFACWAMIFLGIIGSGLSISMFDLRAFWRVVDYLDGEARRYNSLFHLKPVAHLSSYFIGVLLGYYMINSEKEPSKRFILFGWIAWLILTLTKILFFFYDAESHQLPLFLYGTLSKTLWSLLVAWLIFNIEKVASFSKSYKFLSKPSMQVVSRLSLALMCVNIVILRWKNSIAQSPSEIQVFKFIFIEHLPYIVFMYLISFASTILVCYPTGKLLKAFFMGSPRSERQEKGEESSKNGAELEVIKVNLDSSAKSAPVNDSN